MSVVALIGGTGMACDDCLMVRRAIALGSFAVAIVVGVLTLDLVRESPGYGLAGTSPLDAVALLLPGWALVAGGLGSWLRRPESSFGVLLAAAGFAWFAPEWDNPDVGSSLAFTAGLCVFAACPPLVAHPVLVFPAGRLGSRLDRLAVVTAYAGNVVLLGLLPALFLDPGAHGCSACPSNLLVVSDRPALAEELTRAGLYAAPAWATALAILACRRLTRHATRSVVAPAAAYLALVTATFALSFGEDLPGSGTAERRLWLAQALALVALVAGVVWGWARARRARAEVARLVVELGQSAPPGGLRDALAGIVRDPGLVLAYPLDNSGRYVDADGRPLELPRELERTSLLRDGRPVAVIAHAPGRLADEQLVEEVTAAARLALENERLQAEVRSRLEELRASRARIVAAGDLERKRLERDLHDGAQQRLVAFSLSLRLLRQKAPESDHLRRADEELAAAIEELRELAHGIFPAVLADDGLSAAVQALVEEARVPVRVGALPERRFDPTLESAAYTVVAETVRAASGSVAVSALEAEGRLTIELETSSLNGLDVVALEDRLGALDGRLQVTQAADGTTVGVELPCGS